MKRNRLSRRGSRKMFEAGSRTKGINLAPPPQRGGYRM